MKKNFLITAATLAAISLAADGEATGSSSSPSPTPTPTPEPEPESEEKQPILAGSLQEDPNDPNAVMGGPKLEAERRPAAPAAPVAPSPEPIESPGQEAFDLSSQRETELFDSSDVVFVREGPNGSLVPYPRHEAETRFSPIVDRKSDWKKDRTVTHLALENGSNVTIDGGNVTVTTPEQVTGGYPLIGGDGPALNLHGPAVP